MYETSLVDGCAFLARRLHRDQMYGEDQRYEVHLGATVAVMRRFGIRNEVKLGAGWLHDSIEDTDATQTSLLAYLTLGYGEAAASGVVELVDAVTSGTEGARAEKNERFYVRVPKAKGAILVKIGDRIANMEEGLAKGNEGLVSMYREEFPEFEARLFNTAHARKHKIEGYMWRHLRLLVNA